MIYKERLMGFILMIFVGLLIVIALYLSRYHLNAELPTRIPTSTQLDQTNNEDANVNFLAVDSTPTITSEAHHELEIPNKLSKDKLSTKRYRIQVASFNNRENAVRLQKKLNHFGIKVTIQVITQQNNHKIYKLVSSVYKNQNEILALNEKLHQAVSIKGVIVNRE